MASTKHNKVNKTYKAEIKHFVKSYGSDESIVRDDILTDAHFTTNVDTPSDTEAVLTGAGRVKGNTAGSNLIEDGMGSVGSKK